MDSERTGNNEILIITVDVRKLNKEKLLPDLDHGAWDDDGNPLETEAEVRLFV